MKKIVLAIEKSEKSFSDFKKNKIEFEKVFLSKLWNFSKKNSKVSDLALDFRGLKDFEKPEFKYLKEIKYFFVDKENIDLIKFTKINKKLIFSLSLENNEKELKKIFKKKKDDSEKDFQKFLKSIFLEILVEKKDEEYLFKKIVFLKKILLKILGKEKSSLVKIVIKNNFSLDENKDILNNKLYNIHGVIMK